MSATMLAIFLGVAGLGESLAGPGLTGLLVGAVALALHSGWIGFSGREVSPLALRRIAVLNLAYLVASAIFLASRIEVLPVWLQVYLAGEILLLSWLVRAEWSASSDAEPPSPDLPSQH